jgi:hypothetical protein
MFFGGFLRRSSYDLNKKKVQSSGRRMEKISDNRLLCQNTITTNHTLILENYYWVSLFYRNNDIQTFCYCVSHSCFVWIYNHTDTIVSQ